ncbi:MAG TPA: hypothetical protein VJ521_10015 [Acidobacteriota bacterium]|nr:hypothetical protein [Acidobacteriota bacterium]
MNDVVPIKWTSILLPRTWMKGIRAQCDKRPLLRFTVIGAVLITQVIGLAVTVVIGILIGSAVTVLLTY